MQWRGTQFMQIKCQYTIGSKLNSTCKNIIIIRTIISDKKIIISINDNL